jgi:GT2 family glycosyltransferase
MESVFSQDYPGKIKLIVVDQSKDHNEEVRKFFRDHQDDFHYIFQPQPNLPKAENTGLSAAKGELIFFCADDWILPSHAVSSLARHFRPFRRQVVAGVAVSEGDPERSLQDYAKGHGTDVIRQTGLKKVRGFFFPVMLLPTEVVRAVGGYDDLMGDLTPTAAGEDHDFQYRLRLAKIPIFIDPSVHIVHKDHLAGGCATRCTDPQVARKYQIRSIAYMSAKYHGRVGLRGWIRVVRGYVLNRLTLSKGLPYVRSCFQAARSAVREAEAFIAANKKQEFPPTRP